nr:unnamed protein product [Spirometra erinaceieuropaei]
MAISDELNNKFYEDPHALLATVPKVDKLVFPGEFKVLCRDRQTGWGEEEDRESWIRMTPASSFCEPAQNTVSPLHEHLLPYFDTRGDNLDAPLDRDAGSCWTTFSSDGKIKRACW